MRNPDITGFTRIRKSEVGYSAAYTFLKIEKMLSDEFFNNRLNGQMRNMTKYKNGGIVKMKINEFCEKYKVSHQTVYEKLHRRENGVLSGHIKKLPKQ